MMTLSSSNIPYLTYNWPVVTGCSGTGCSAKCWAKALAHRYGRSFAPTFNTGHLSDPLRTRKPAIIGVAFTGEIFDVAITDEQIAAVWGVMAAASQHTFIVLTKQAARLEQWHAEINRLAGQVAGGDAHSRICWPLPNAWLGVSVSTQAEADERISHLLRTPAAHRWVSVEPMLEGIELHLPDYPTVTLDAVIAGGESGHDARPCAVGWLHSIARQCQAAGVPHWLKQLGSNPWANAPDGTFVRWGGTGYGSSLVTPGRAGEDERGWPADLRAMRSAVPWMQGWQS